MRTKKTTISLSPTSRLKLLQPVTVGPTWGPLPCALTFLAIMSRFFFFTRCQAEMTARQGELSGRWRTGGQEEVRLVETPGSVQQPRAHEKGSPVGKVKEASMCCVTMQKKSCRSPQTSQHKHFDQVYSQISNQHMWPHIKHEHYQTNNCVMNPTYGFCELKRKFFKSVKSVVTVTTKISCSFLLNLSVNYIVYTRH